MFTQCIIIWVRTILRLLFKTLCCIKAVKVSYCLHESVYEMLIYWLGHKIPLRKFIEKLFVGYLWVALPIPKPNQRLP